MKGRPPGSKLEGTRYDKRVLPQHDVRAQINKEARNTKRAWLKAQIHSLEKTKQRSGFLNPVDETRLRDYKKQAARA